MAESEILIVSVSVAYGREIITPVCAKSKQFAKLLGQKTLTHENIKVLKEIGYEIKTEVRLL